MSLDHRMGCRRRPPQSCPGARRRGGPGDPAALRIVARHGPAGDRARCGDGHARQRGAACRHHHRRARRLLSQPGSRAWTASSPPWRAVSAASASPSMPGRAGSSRPSARSPSPRTSPRPIGTPRPPWWRAALAMRCWSISGRPPPTSCRSSPASPLARGFNDHDRLVAGELVYMGLTRTPVAAIADRVPFRGRWSTMMNEYFATMADVWRGSMSVPPDLDQHATADNRPKDRVASMARLAAHGRDWTPAVAMSTTGSSSPPGSPSSRCAASRTASTSCNRLSICRPPHRSSPPGQGGSSSSALRRARTAAASISQP